MVHGCDGDEDYKESIIFGYHIEELCRYRAFFITEKGRMGLGSTHVLPGASIYLIHGLSTPFVVSRVSGDHVLRGECYVHELMDSMAVTFTRSLRDPK